MPGSATERARTREPRRERLLARLDDALRQHRVAALIAGPGCGKSVALEQFAACNPYVRKYRASSLDANPNRLVGSLLAAVDKTDLAPSVLRVLEADGVRAAARAAAEIIPNGMTIAIEDFQEAAHSQDYCAFLTHVIEASDRVRFLIASRVAATSRASDWSSLIRTLKRQG